MARRATEFQTIRSEGGLLPPDLLRHLLDPKEELDGTRPEDYGLPQGERLNEIIIQSWNRLRKHWAQFRAAAANLPEGEAGTGLTNDKLSLPLLRELGFGLLPTSAGPEVGGRTYAISRFFGPVPVHLIGCGLDLDRRATGMRGAAAVNPHGLVQEFLNRSPKHLWGIVANGLGLRILRDSQALSRQSFLEFDLEAMFAGEIYSDFVLLWLVAHATRFAPREADRPDSCWLEQWTKLANEQGTRALGDLRGGVEKALQILGEGFTGHPRNMALRDALRTGHVPLADLHGQLLRVVYRLIFLFVAEDRTIDGQSLLHPRDVTDGGRLARECYVDHYSTSRLRELASKIKGSRHGDMWRQFQILVGALSGDTRSAAVRGHLALPALGSFLWDAASTAALNDSELTNHDFLEALRHLAFTRQGKVLRPVDYKNLGAEELGGIYETLLALTPQISADGARFNFAEFAGNERKTSGSYYTPDSLVQCLLDSALDPVVEEAIKGKVGAEAEKAILALKVCDPAVGSGHFLVGAAHRLARHLARVRAQAHGDSEPSPMLYQHAVRDVIGRCLYAVDLNPMAAELCRVSLWLEALEPGKPLSFLDHHIRVGNSLLGATPDLIAAGLPDDAFAAIEGDDKRTCTDLKRRNKQEREGQRDMLHLMVAEPEAEYNSIASRTRGIEEAPDSTIDEIQRKAEQFGKLVLSPGYLQAQMVADAWCAAFVWNKQANAPIDPITTDTIRRLEAAGEALPAAQRNEVERLTRLFQFFHWYLAFPDVFASGGFDCLLGNPPWESSEFKEKEWFSDRDPGVTTATTGVKRKQLIADLESSDQQLYEDYLHAKQMTDRVGSLFRHSGLFLLTGVGKVNTFAVFAELFTRLQSPRGRSGCLMPSGIAFNDTTKLFFQKLIKEHLLISLFDFENRKPLFPDIHSSTRFCLLTMVGHGQPASLGAEFAFFLHDTRDLLDDARRFRLGSEDIQLLNPNTLTCPSFRSRLDADITLAIYRRLPIIMPETGSSSSDWGLATKPGLFNMTHDSGHFLSADDLDIGGISEVINLVRRSDIEYVPLCEAKMFDLFDHRAAGVVISRKATIRMGQPEPFSYSDHCAPFACPTPRFWVPKAEVDRRLEGEWTRGWLFGWKHVGSPTNARTLVPFLSPRYGVADSLYVAVSSLYCDAKAASMLACVVAGMSSFVADFVARQKMGGTNLTPFIFKQLPALSPKTFECKATWKSSDSQRGWLKPRILELVYSAWDLEPFAQDCDWPGPPFRWDEERRFLLRCELDAAFFHLYLPAEANGDWRPAEREAAEDLARLKGSLPTPHDAVVYIMDTFPIVRRKDEEKHNGDYRTKRVILEIYDAMLASIRTGQPYQTRLDPPPADPRCCHPPREVTKA